MFPLRVLVSGCGYSNSARAPGASLYAPALQPTRPHFSRPSSPAHLSVHWSGAQLSPTLPILDLCDYPKQRDVQSSIFGPHCRVHAVLADALPPVPTVAHPPILPVPQRWFFLCDQPLRRDLKNSARLSSRASPLPPQFSRSLRRRQGVDISRRSSPV